MPRLSFTTTSPPGKLSKITGTPEEFAEKDKKEACIFTLLI